MEIFDVVDDRDRVIGQAERAQVHAQGLLHRAVHILVFDSLDRLFLQKRSRCKDTFPGCWDSSAAGHLETGEDYATAALREVREELGISISSLEELLYLPACPQTGWEFIRVYRTRHDGPFILPPEEIETGGWFAPSFVTAWCREHPEEFASGFVYLWQRLTGEGIRF